MNFAHFWKVTAIIAVIIIIIFIFTAPHTHDASGGRGALTATSTPPAVTLSDTYKKGVHTLRGTVEAPDACASLSVEASLQGDASTSQSILVAASLPDNPGICLQIPTTLSFSTTINAPANLPITMTVNGATATTSAP